MIIPINLPPYSKKPQTKFPLQLAKLGTDEIILIELQGSFHVEGDASGQLAARLKLDNESKPTMLIGHNLLEGKMVNLSKPLAVLCRKGPDASDVQLRDESALQDSNNACEYDMVAVVKRKVLFSKRPMPVVNIGSVSEDSGAKDS